MVAEHLRVRLERRPAGPRPGVSWTYVVSLEESPNGIPRGGLAVAASPRGSPQANNCDVYVLRKDLSRPGPSPYVLDGSKGDRPKSSLDVVVSFKDGAERTYALENYLDLPPPRTDRVVEAAWMISQQHAGPHQGASPYLRRAWTDRARRTRQSPYETLKRER